MRKILLFTIAFLMMITLMPASASASSEGNNNEGLSVSNGTSLTDIIAMIPSGYGVPSGFDFSIITTESARIPLRKIAAIEILERSQPIDMRVPLLPDVGYSALDKDGNYLITSDLGHFVSESDTIAPTNLSNGYIDVPFVLGDVTTYCRVDYTFDRMNTIEKINYSYMRGWISEAEYNTLVGVAFTEPQNLPSQYFSSTISDESTPILGTYAELQTRALPDLSSYTYYTTNDGKVRIYAYDVTNDEAVSASYANTVKNLFNSYSIRSNVLSKFGLSSLPQENSGYTVVQFNTSLNSSGGGQTVNNGDNTYHLELATSAGRYVVTHEYAHIAQMNGHGRAFSSGLKWWMEGTADWVGKVLASNNHYLSRLEIIQNLPTKAYDYEESSFGVNSRGYGSAAFAMFLEATSGNGTVASSFTYNNAQARDAINQALGGGTGIATAFNNYAKKMYRPSTQMTSTVSYAGDWAEASYKKTGLMADNSSKTMSTSSIEHLGVDYIRIQTSTNNSRTITISLPSVSNGCNYYLLKRGSSSTSWTYEPLSSSTVSVANYNTTVKELVICVVNTSGSTKTNISYTITVTP